MKIRTYGWIQNPSNFSSLKKVIQIFDSNSKHYEKLRDKLVKKIYFDDIRKKLQDKLDNNITTFTYQELVGSSKDKTGKSPKSRPDAVADALIQVTIIPQQVSRTGKDWTDNWTADGFLRWAVSLNLLETDRDQDIFYITDKGLEFSKVEEGTEEEKQLLQKVLLSYPPAVQILSLLKENGDYCTKYFLGEQLGFRGEKGFTSYNEDLMFDWLSVATKEEQKSIKSDVEGTSDKYARGICNWLKNVDLIYTKTVKREFKTGGSNGFQGYKINAKGIHLLEQSKRKKTEKFVMWEFFATSAENKNYIRTRRAYILKFLQKTQSFSVVLNNLRMKGFNDDKEIIIEDLKGLVSFGLRIELNIQNNKVILRDRLNDFTIPNIEVTRELKNEKSIARKAEFLRNTSLPMKYIELLDIAYDGKRDRDFEIVTMELFREVYRFNSKLLGGGRKPDGLIYTDNFGVIVDTKAYGKGYAKSISQADEMIRYIVDNQRRDINRNPIKWWEDFPESIPENSFYFLWVSSEFIGKFQEQLTYTANETRTKGAAINVEQLLIGADLVKKGLLDVDKISSFFDNREILFEKV